MKEGPDIARIAGLIGDPARANILTALVGGRALTASELAAEAGVTPQTASAHLSRLSAGGLIVLRRQGRHRYFSLAGAEVAQVLEGLMGLAAGAGHLRTRTGPRDTALRKARVCYNHLAGERGTALFDRFVAMGYLVQQGDGVELTPRGAAAVRAFGVDPDRLAQARAPLCRPCLDWSERRTHLAGSLGRAILGRMEALAWVRRQPDSRVVTFTPAGERAFRDWLGGA